MNRSSYRRGFRLALVLSILGVSLQGCGQEAPGPAASAEQETALEHARKHLDPGYVCPMHPQVVSSEPGECPICGMDLVAREADGAEADPQAAGPGETPAITVSDAVVNRLGVRTAAVRRGRLDLEVQGVGVFARSGSASTMLVVAQVFERDAPLVRQGQAARVRLLGLGSREWTGTVANLEGQINPSTHTLQFRVTVDSAGAQVPGGTTALVSVTVDPVTDGLLVPRESVIRTGKGARVVVAQGGGRFQPRAVEAEDLGGEEMVIRSGLQEGELVVVSAQFLLDSEANLQAGLRRLTATPPDSPAAHQGAVHDPAMHEGHLQEAQSHEGHTHEGHLQDGAMDEGGMHEGHVHEGTMQEGTMQEGIGHQDAMPPGPMDQVPQPEGAAQ